MKKRKKGAYSLDNISAIFSNKAREKIEANYEIVSDKLLETNASSLATVQVLFTGWGCPLLTAGLLDRMPKLQAIFHAAGSIRPIIPNDFWGRKITISSAWSVNAVPVAEFTVSLIFLSLKQVFRLSREMHEIRSRPEIKWIAGGYQSNVGLVGLGMTGRLVAQKLAKSEVRVFGYDPTLSTEQFKAINVTPLSLEELFETCDVVSLHAPLIDKTRGMIHRRILEKMVLGATLINTARGGLIKEQDLVEILNKRQDIFAICDVTDLEPPELRSPLYTMKNILLTPHLAGSIGKECWRLGDAMVAEALRFNADMSLEYSITEKMYSNMA